MLSMWMVPSSRAESSFPPLSLRPRIPSRVAFSADSSPSLDSVQSKPTNLTRQPDGMELTSSRESMPPVFSKRKVVRLDVPASEKSVMPGCPITDRLVTVSGRCSVLITPPSGSSRPVTEVPSNQMCSRLPQPERSTACVSAGQWRISIVRSNSLLPRYSSVRLPLA